MLVHMSQVAISLPEILDAEVQKRAKAAGFSSKQDYLLEIVRTHCEQAELESLLESRLDGPFAPLESNWKERVRNAAKQRG
jgi:hypothetical protein